MDPKQIKEIVGSLPYMSLERGQKLYALITEHRLEQCLELGFYHGVSSAYIAAALDSLGSGSLVTIDKVGADRLKPNIEDLMRLTGLGRYVKHYFEPRSYTWRLMHLLKQGYSEHFDFCYLDGGHTWDCTGFAFFLVSRLLKPGGWIVFDDLDWTVDKSASLKDSKWASTLPEEEKTAAPVSLVFDLLVRSDPHFAEFCTEGNWAYAKKIKSMATVSR